MKLNQIHAEENDVVLAVVMSALIALGVGVGVLVWVVKSGGMW